MICVREFKEVDEEFEERARDSEAGRATRSARPMAAPACGVKTENTRDREERKEEDEREEEDEEREGEESSATTLLMRQNHSFDSKTIKY